MSYLSIRCRKQFIWWHYTSKDTRTKEQNIYIKSKSKIPITIQSNVAHFHFKRHTPSTSGFLVLQKTQNSHIFSTWSRKNILRYSYQNLSHFLKNKKIPNSLVLCNSLFRTAVLEFIHQTTYSEQTYTRFLTSHLVYVKLLFPKSCSKRWKVIFNLLK